MDTSEIEQLRAEVAEFRESFYNFRTIDDHVQHIAQLEARGLLDARFTEGYGPLADFGIEARVVEQDTEISDGGTR